MKTHQRRGLSLAVAMCLATGTVVLSGCSASAPASGGGAAPAPAATQAASYPQEDTGYPRNDPEAPNPNDGRKIARSASVSVVVEDIRQAAQGLHDLADTVGGIVTNESLSLPSEADSRRASGSVVVSVPAEKLDAALDQIEELGKVTDRQIESVDVTEQVVDVESRIKTMEQSITRLQELMVQSGSVTEISSVERELTQRQADLESLLAQQASLSQKVDSAPISVSLRTASVGEAASSNAFLSALRDGWEAMGSAGRYAIIAIGALLPWLALAALVLVPIIVVRRRHRRNVPPAAPVAAPAWMPSGPTSTPVRPPDGAASPT